jgi:hypothetical protein
MGSTRISFWGVWGWFIFPAGFEAYIPISILYRPHDRAVHPTSLYRPICQVTNQFSLAVFSAHHIQVSLLYIPQT